MVGFAQHIIGIGNVFLGNRRLRPHRINRNDAA